MRPALGMWRSAKDAYQLRRLRIRKRAKEKGIKDAEHRGVHANPQRQGEYCDDGKAWVLEQHSKGIAHILNQACHGRSFWFVRCGPRLNIESHSTNTSISQPQP